jgi:glyoxylase-like metal-dependent hydrolase (beta-lactamase superfamily II)
MRIEKLTVPTPFPVGPINLYLIVEDPLTLIDTGPKTEESLAALHAEFKRLDIPIESLSRVILTHTHEDHCGLAAYLQKLSGAKVHVHEWELHNVSDRRENRVNRRLLEQTGVPPAMIDQMADRYAEVKGYGESVEDVEPFRDDHEFIFASGSLRVVHTPGHTPGSCCLLRESNRLLLSGDTILKTITPNPVLNPDPIDPARRFPSLGEYLVSLARIRSLAPTLIRTSHGADVTDYEEHFGRLIRHIRERLAQVVSLVPSEGVTAWEMSRRMFPTVKEIHLFLAVSEAIANLDQGVADGKLKIERSGSDGIVETFFRANSAK